jgi:DNA-binding HxlR family transcriptional regulator
VAKVLDSSCSIARSLGVLGERWTFLILRDAFDGFTRFDEFRRSLGIASDVLSARLATLVEHGVLVKVDYQEPGERRRHAYQLTDAGRELFPVLLALQEWGDRHLPRAEGPTVLRRESRTGRELHVALVDDAGVEVAPEEIEMVRTPVYPEERLRLLRRLASGGTSPGAVPPPA